MVRKTGARHAGPLVLGIGEDGLADLLREREACGAPILAATQSVPSCQSISRHCKAATSPARSPKRARSKRTARSRTPHGVVRSQLVNTRSTVSAADIRRAANRQWAMVGRAWSRPGVQRPMAMRKRRNIRTAVTTVLARPMPLCPARSSTKAGGPCLKALGLVSERVEQSGDRQTVAVEGRLRSSRGGCASRPKGSQEFGLRRGWGHRGRRAPDPAVSRKRHKVTRPHKEMATAATGIAQALEALEVLPKRLQGLRIELLQRNPALWAQHEKRCDTAQQVRDPAWLIAAGFKPARKASRWGPAGPAR